MSILSYSKHMSFLSWPVCFNKIFANSPPPPDPQYEACIQFWVMYVHKIDCCLEHLNEDIWKKLYITI